MLEEMVKDHFERFLTSLSPYKLKKLLKFWTASDCLLDENLKVGFNSLDDIMLRPTATTCSNMLHISRNYRTFEELKSNILTYILSEEARSFDSI